MHVFDCTVSDIVVCVCVCELITALLGIKSWTQHFIKSLWCLQLFWMCSNPISHSCTDLHCTAVTQVIPLHFVPPSRTQPMYDCIITTQCAVIWGNSPFQFSNSRLFFFLSPSLSLVPEMAKCEFWASRWDWWACATQTSRRSTNVSGNACVCVCVFTPPPKLQTMSQNKTALIASIT